MHMAHSFSIQIDNLRKRSRALLAHLEKNSKIVKREIKKLRLQNLISQQEDRFKTYNHHLIPEKSSKIWKLRNDSSGVAGALCPDYFRLSPKYRSTSVPDMTSSGRILIMCTKRQLKPSWPRKPVKECYCYSETRKMQLRSIRTKHKPNIICHYCKGHCSNVPILQKEVSKNNTHKNQTQLITENSNAQTTIFPSISNKMLRKVQKIDYAPRSQFLRNVQNKVSSLQNIPSRNLPEPLTSLNQLLKRLASSTHKHLNRTWSDNLIYKNSWAELPQESVTMPDKRSSDINKETNFSNHSYTYINKDIEIPSQKISVASTDKRATTSKTSVPNKRKETLVLKSPSRSRRTTHPVSNDSIHSYDRLKMLEENAKNPSKENINKSNKHSKHYRQKNLQSKNDGRDENYTKRFLEDNIKELHKFREQNYFDTHGSSQTLLDSQSFGSLLQYQLNERLYPEPIRRIHKNDLVVTMPPCITKQRKSIHYLPKNIVKQEKNNYNTNYKKKRRYQPSNCPLTGHAIDFEILKVCHNPLNSLALKYQK